MSMSSLATMLGLPQAPLSTTIPTSEVEVIPPGGKVTEKELPCPYCGSTRLDGPEGEAWQSHYHCWKCGYQPAVNTGISEYEQRQAFEAFKTWIASQSQNQASAPQAAVSAPADDEVSRLKAQIAAMQTEMAKS